MSKGFTVLCRTVPQTERTARAGGPRINGVTIRQARESPSRSNTGFPPLIPGNLHFGWDTVTELTGCQEMTDLGLAHRERKFRDRTE